MKARVIKLEEDVGWEDTTLTVRIWKPRPPHYYADTPEKEAAEYKRAYKAYEEQLKEYEQLRLGSINFWYETEPKCKE